VSADTPTATADTATQPTILEVWQIKAAVLSDREVRCALFDRSLPSRMLLDPAPVRLKRPCVRSIAPP
jgi:hypothetical protein